MHQEKELVPYADQVQERFQNWLAQQTTSGRKFTDEQSQWLAMIRDHVAQSLELDLDDLTSHRSLNMVGWARPPSCSARS